MEESKTKLKKSIRIRNRKEALKEEKENNVGKQGAAKASMNNIPTTPRKMRIVADMIRGQKVNNALNILKYEPKQGAVRLEKLLLTAISNWQANNEDVRLEEADLYVKEIMVNGGRMLKRLRPAPQGRAHRIRKRSNHVIMVIDSLNPPVMKEEETKSQKTKKKK
ncbi:MAG: 50S ribosomal protein L22 [Bacteroidetes bacterium]|nr:50S ribosomal protein L22 [Bacteroidota bacterium]